MEHRYHIFWPLVFIATGVMWLLIEMGRVPVENLWALTYLWPLILIFAGIGLLLRPFWKYAGMLISVLIVGSLFFGVLFADRLGLNHLPQPLVVNGLFLNVSSERGSGNIITQSRSVQDFNRVHINYPGNVVIKQGPTESLTITGDDNVVASIKTQVVNHVLEIDNVKDHALYIAPTRPVQITIMAKDLAELDFNAAGEVSVNGLKTTDLTARMDGAGSMKLLNLVVNSLTAKLTGVGSTQASGVAKTVTVQVDGLGDFDGSQLKAQDVTATLNGLGGAKVWAENTLTATVNGVGSVTYSGSPQVTKSVNGAGSVHASGTK